MIGARMNGFAGLARKLSDRAEAVAERAASRRRKASHEGWRDARALWPDFTEGER
ncbi:hypothetical protein [Aurantiacibacter gangjinensis]|uniref:hypothetical protein n=1 Tax=Aurantiacibacter gangjinensis TaxID=502682 RepID=UPI00090AE299|nr:hypothetical protein [Aurantiacibacter gangjinensis]APE27658.1 hypothetical protein BMF35_a0829 [Aurantiacibacter gangjinensis]